MTRWALLVCLASLASCGGAEVVADDPVARCLNHTVPEWRACSVGELPFMGSEIPLADRTRVGADWMRDAFDELVSRAPAGSLVGFESLTGVVIAEGVSPSYVSLRTGALYLDPAILVAGGLELEAGAPGLGFTIHARYLDPTAAPLAVLFHELAHALDQFPPDVVLTADPSRTPEAIARGRAERSVSASLPILHPLQAGALFDLTRVTVDGDPPTASQRAYAAEQAAADFDGDGANDFHAYLSPQEDLAMLIEELQVARHLGVRREVSVRRVADGEVVWGQVGRIAAPQVRARLRHVASRLLPDPEAAASAIDALPPPEELGVSEARP